MYVDVDVYDDQDVSITFDDYNNDRIIRKLERHDNLPKKAFEKIKEALAILADLDETFELEAHINEVQVSEDDVVDAYNSVSEDKKEYDYDDGYQAALDDHDRTVRAFLLNNSMLVNKLNHLAYGFGKQEDLSQDELKQICDFMEM